MESLEERSSCEAKEEIGHIPILRKHRGTAIPAHGEDAAEHTLSHIVDGPIGDLTERDEGTSERAEKEKTKDSNPREGDKTPPCSTDEEEEPPLPKSAHNKLDSSEHAVSNGKLTESPDATDEDGNKIG